MHVLLAPHGTRGDLQPMLALAVALGARGHLASFVAPDNFVGWIRSHGFEAEPDGIDVEAMLRLSGAKLDSFRWQRRHFVDVLIPRLFESVARASPDADVIVGAGVQMAAASVAEARDVPYASVGFCPCVVPSGGAPPPMVRTQTLPAWLNRLLWQAGRPLADLMLRGPINAGRATLGLPPVEAPLSDLIGRRIIIAADPDLAPLSDDAPATAVVTDAWVLDEPSDLDPRVEAFLRLNPLPVYVGFGSMVPARSSELAAHAVDAARALGRPALIAGGWARLDRHVSEGADVLAVDHVSHRAVFPRVAAVVHHGGAGTTTAAARAGAPQVVLPHILDQFYWAHRVQVLGLGPRPLPVDLVTADVLADRLHTALTDARIRARAAALAPAIAARDGVEAAVDHLERVALHSAA
jgi:vancomycin aglycone glucosyltransferase